MSAITVYGQVRNVLNRHLDGSVDPASRERIALLVLGILNGKSAAPARIAAALSTLGLTDAQPESIARRIRRIENDPELSAATCLHPLARHYLALGRPEQLMLVLDPTTQEDKVVMLSVSVWYRGRALPLAWAAWPANQVLMDEKFWQRVDDLLLVVASVLPPHIPVVWLADRAFGTPSFLDLLAKHAPQWHYLVRIQRQTRWRNPRHSEGGEQPVDDLVDRPGARAKCRGELFKKRGWRPASIVAYWSRNTGRNTGRNQDPLILITDLRPRWSVIKLYRCRFVIEAGFRDYKSHGWQWEEGQVTDPKHLERLLVGMALATWIALMVGTQAAAELLARRPTGHRHTRPPDARYSLFTLGLHLLDTLFVSAQTAILKWSLTDWDQGTWSQQITNHHLRAFVFASQTKC
jgi:hypothetical protein